MTNLSINSSDITNIILGLGALIYAVNRIFPAKYTKETILILEKNIAAKDQEIKELMSDHTIELAERDKKIIALQKDVEALKTQNDGLFNRAANTELFSKIEQNLEGLKEKQGFILQSIDEMNKVLRDEQLDILSKKAQIESNE